ncbi:MAG: MtaA/CmuA family methyltransferase [SAR202 cluster bacterium]|nr:MtaA/CmuA family methyltransferase [SAR202 cluster bacterium]
MAFKETMKPRERVHNALNGLPVDRPPVSNPTSVLTVELMDLVGASFPKALRDPDDNAALAATGHTELGFDSVYACPTLVIESSALGCEIQWEQKDNWPTVRMTNPIWKGPDEIKIPSNFMEHRDIKAINKSIEILKRDLGDEVAVFGKVTGPWTMGYHVYGVQNFLMMSIDDEVKTKKSLEKLKEICIMFGESQIAAGADALTFSDHPTGDLVSGDWYMKYLQELHTEMVERLDVPLILHICGRTVDRMDYIAQTGMAAFHFDSKNDPKESMDIMKKRVRLVGNLNTPVTIYSKGPDDVKAEVFKALDAGVEMIAPEGAVPLRTRLENILAIPAAVKEWCETNDFGGNGTSEANRN